MLSGRGLCDELITRPEESYRLWCFVMCDLGTSSMRRPRSALGRRVTTKYKLYFRNFLELIMTSLVYVIYVFTSSYRFPHLILSLCPHLSTLTQVNNDCNCQEVMVDVAIIVTGSPDSSNFLLNIFWNRIHEPKSLESKKLYLYH